MNTAPLTTSSTPAISPDGAATAKSPLEAPGIDPSMGDAGTTSATSTEPGSTASNPLLTSEVCAVKPLPKYGPGLTEVIAASARAKAAETVILLPAEVDALLTRLGLTSIGPDPVDRHLTIWHQPQKPLFVALPAKASGPDIARAIWHAGAAEARRQIREAHRRFVSELG